MSSNSPIPTLPDPPRSSSFPLWPIALGIFGMLVLFSAIGIGSFYLAWQEIQSFVAEEPGDRSNFEELRDRVQESGRPVSSGELLAWYPPVDGPNAADELMRAWEVLGIEDGSVEGVEVYTRNRVEFAYEEPSADVLEGMRELVSRHETVVAHLYTATDMAHARFPVGFDDGGVIDESHIDPMIAFNQLLGMSADIAAADGDIDAAVDAIRRGFRLASFLDEVPLLRSNFMAEVVRREAIGTLRRILSRYPLPREALEELREILEGIDPIANLHRAMQAQQAAGITLLELQFEQDSPAPSDRKTEEFFEFLDIAFADMGDALPVAHSFRPVGSAFQGYLYCEDLLPLHICQAPVVYKRDLASVRMALLIVAVERFRDDHGRVPMALEELVPDYVSELPIDPFDPDGHHIRAGRHSSAYFFYSVYIDGKDGGGRDQVNVMSRDPEVRGDDILYVRRGLN